MKPSESGTVRLFTYGTLQLPEVQRANFGRLLEGSADVLPGYVLGTVEIADPAVVSLSGTATHKIVRKGSGDVAGMVLSLTPEELAAADSYETDDYARVTVRLASGIEAFVYAAHE